MINFSDQSKIAIKTKNSQVTYNELNDKICAFSTLFNNVDKIAIFSENREEWIFAFYAGWKNISTVVPIDFMASNHDISFILNDCKPEVLFTSNGKIKDVDVVLKNLDYKPIVINFDELKLPEKIEIDDWKQPADNEKIACIIYTSGTTGSPKGVMLSFTNLLANLKAVVIDADIFNANRQVLMFLPLHHIFPLVGTMIAPLHVNATIVVTPSMQNSDLIETLKNNQAAIMIGVPRLYELMYKGIKAKIDASFVGQMLFKFVSTTKARGLAKKIFGKVHQGLGGYMEIMVAGGAALPKHVGEFFYCLGFNIVEGFGMTEAAPMITFTRPGKIKPGSPGQKVNDLQVEIRDGEIVAKGASIMKGYYNRPEETAEVIKDGWLYTGDLGYFDKDGFLFITGRKKEIIVLSNGKNINPVEIEIKLEKSSPFITEAAVFLHKEALHAVIVPNYNELSNAGVKDIVAFFKNEVILKHNENESSYKRIMQFTLIKNEIPRTRLGKIQRFKLAELLAGTQKKKTTADEPDTEEYKSIKVFIEDQVNGEISADDHLEFDIALDSLGKLSLVDFIDRSFGVKIEEKHLLTFPSVRKLVEFVSDNKLRHKIESIDWSAILKEKVHLTLPKAWFTQSVFKTGSKYFFKIYFRFKADGIKNIPEGPCIIAPNHQSFFDGLFVASLLKRKTMRNTYFYAKKKHVNNALLRFLARKNNIIVMDINNDLKESIQKLAEVLKMGRNIIIFPEGTRTKDGALGEFKQMFAILSKELNVPVVPVAIKGAYNALPKGKFTPRIFTPINVHFLQPVYPENFDYASLSSKVKNNIQERIGVI
jgi:long-chain acyl-CoA synthetase